jgi:AAA15 family ATPase/GTPase
MEIKVIPSKNGIGNTKPVHEDLPKMNSFIAVVGSRGSGKSNFVKNLLMRKDMYKGKFHKDSIFIFSPSLDLNGDYDDIPTKYKFSTFSNDLLYLIIQKQKEVIEMYGKKRVRPILMVLDDIIDTGLLDPRGAIELLAVRGRHLMITVIIVSQSFKRISRTMRLQLNALYFFRSNNIGEIDRVVEELVPKKNQQRMLMAIKNIFETPYAFITVDFDTTNMSRRFRKGLSEPIDLKNVVMPENDSI